jgi:hypothetical protein
MNDQPRTDRRRQVAAMLGDPETASLSDREIARQCGVSHPVVARIRRELTTPALEPELGPLPVPVAPSFPLLPRGRQVWPPANVSDVDLPSLIEGLGAGLVTLHGDARQHAVVAVLDGQVRLAYSVIDGTHRHGAAALTAVEEIHAGRVTVEALPREVVSGLAPSWPRPARTQDIEALIASTRACSLLVSTPRGVAWLLAVEGRLVGAWCDWGDTTTEGVVATIATAGSWVVSTAAVPVPEALPRLDTDGEAVIPLPSPRASSSSSSSAAAGGELPLWPADRAPEADPTALPAVQADDPERPDLLATLCEVGAAHLGVYGDDVRRVLLTERPTLAGLHRAVRRIDRTALHPGQWDRLAPLLAQLDETIQGRNTQE